VRVLVTNDDGITSPGLAALAVELAGRGHDVVVAAPLTDHSGASASLTVDLVGGIGLQQIAVEAMPGVVAFGVEGSPALSVLLARLGCFGDPPGAVVSGINAGLNTGRGLLHSGTVGAALTASNMGWPGIAVSLQGRFPTYWTTAAWAAGEALDWVSRTRRRTLLTISVPDEPLAAVRGIRWAKIAAYGGTRLTMSGRDGKRVQVSEVAGALPPDPQTDAGLVAAGFVAVTPLQGIVALPDPGVVAELDAALTGRQTTDPVTLEPDPA